MTGPRQRTRQNRRRQGALPGMARPFSDEYDFEREVKRLAGKYGWRVLKVPRTRGRHNDWRTYALPGWPDLFLFRAPQLLALELKMPGNGLSDAQEKVLAELQRCTLPLEAWCAYPADLDTITGILSARPDPAAAAAHARLADFSPEQVAAFLAWDPDGE